MSKTQQSRLFLELIEAVIDQVHDDKGTPRPVYPENITRRQRHLLDDLEYNQWRADGIAKRQLLGFCSLVCKSWLPRSRYHLFKEITLGRLHLDRAMNFLDLLDGPLSTIAPYVRMLNLEEGMDRYEHESRWFNAGLLRLTTLYALEQLEVYHGRFDILGTEETTRFFASLQKLQSLRLHYCTFDTHTHLSEALRLAPGLQHILLSAITIHHPEILPHPEATPPSALTNLDINIVDGREGLLKWLTSGPQMPTLETLNLTHIRAKESRVVADFLRALGPSLKKLTLEFEIGSTASQDAFCRDVDLSHNSYLSFIRFNLHGLHTHYWDSQSEVLHVPRVLDQITSTHIEEVAFISGMDAPDNLDVIDWDSIADILQRPNFSRLKRLVMWARTDIMEATKVWIANRLPASRARDMIVFQ